MILCSLSMWSHGRQLSSVRRRLINSRSFARLRSSPWSPIVVSPVLPKGRTAEALCMAYIYAQTHSMAANLLTSVQDAVKREYGYVVVGA
jgi:hypothetical protein